VVKPRKKPRAQRIEASAATAGERSRAGVKAHTAPQTISGRWLLKAFALTIAGAALCCWATLCLLFWQGSWQLLYHPAATVRRTPASAGMKFDPVAFAASELGRTRLAGWWIAAGPGAKFQRFTVLYLYGRNGNLGDAVESLANLHSAGVNVLAFDHRGYGESQFVRPSEEQRLQDGEWALSYLTGTRHISAGCIVLAGEGLGANLALELAAAHPELAGVVVQDPLADATSVIFNDARAKFVPARLLVRDRYNLDAAAVKLRIPSLWLLQMISPPNLDMAKEDSAFQEVGVRKARVWLQAGPAEPRQETDAFSSWLDDLGRPAH